jgi:hypothetical protein
MIVTADPLGDFNATSQILRYSALAREITVPRIPSVTSTILAASIPGANSRSYFSGSHHSGAGRTPSDTERETMEIAALEIARMSEEIDGLRDELLAEQQRRMEVEAHLLSAEDRIQETEAEVREECFAEMEKLMALEMTRWKMSWERERERSDEHIDRKLEVLMRGVELDDDDGENKENEQLETLEDENERLRRQIVQLQRESGQKSPSKKKSVLGESKAWEMEREMLGEGMAKLKLSSQVSDGQKSPTKKIKKMTARKWDMVGEDETI